MLVLFETPAGYAFFKLLDDNKLAHSENLYLDFQTPETASRILNLKYFHKFTDTTEALTAATAAIEGKLCKSLKKALKKHCQDELRETLAVADAKLGSAIKEKLGMPCVSNTAVQELMRCIRNQMDSLLSISEKEMTAMRLGLAHSLSRYKLKFSPDKVDTMVTQAVCALDELDKEINNYIMRCREWYGWHFPELSKIVTDNMQYIRTVQILGSRDNASNCDFSDFLTEEKEEELKAAAELSMGSEISNDDAVLTQDLCAEIIGLVEFRAQLSDYVRSRMMALAPNLSVIVGEFVGARLMAKAGSLVNLAKHPASTVQILGAEKALFRALKMKKDTPKYGIIYHTQLVGQSSKRNKGKMSRMVAAKASLAARFDALGESTNLEMGIDHKAKLEARLRYLEQGNMRKISGTAKAKSKFEKYHTKSEYLQYPASMDSTVPRSQPSKESIGAQLDEITDKKKKKKKQSMDDSTQNKEDNTLVQQEEAQVVTESHAVSKKKKKRDKSKMEESTGEQVEVHVKEELVETSKKKKKRSIQSHTEDTEKLASAHEVQMSAEPAPKKRKHDTESKTEDTERPSQVHDEAQVRTSIPKKKKKRSLNFTEDNEMASSSQVEMDTEAVQKTKKKKKHDTEPRIGDLAESVSTSDPVNESVDATRKKKKKSKKEAIETTEIAIKTESQEKEDVFNESEISGSNEGQKKKKKKSKHSL